MKSDILYTIWVYSNLRQTVMTILTAPLIAEVATYVSTGF